MLHFLRASPQSQVDLGVQAKSIADHLSQGHKGNSLGLVITTYLAHHWKMQYGHLYGPQQSNSSRAPGGMLMDQSAFSGGGESDSSTHEREKPGVAGGLCLDTRASSSGGAASSGSDVVGSPGVVTPTSGSTLGIDNNALSLEVGAIGSFLATSNIWRSSRSPLSIMEVRYLWSSCTAPQSIPRDNPEWTVHFRRAMASAIISLHCTTW